MRRELNNALEQTAAFLTMNDVDEFAARVCDLLARVACKPVLMRAPTRQPVLTDAEVAALEEKHPDAEYCARDIFHILRGFDAPAHGVSVRLGRQLGARYASRKIGPTTFYTISNKR